MGHEKSHGSRSISKYTCPFRKCKATFTSEEELDHHTAAEHPQLPYQCSECHLSYNKSANLQYHKVHKHGFAEQVPKFMCHNCGIRFMISGDLFKHMRSHTGEQPFVCSDCSKTFATKSNLNRHSKIHTEERPHSCFKCGLSFNDASNKNRHELSCRGKS